jgi:monoamine oxidase
MQLQAHGVELRFVSATGETSTMLAGYVISTLPPRLLASTVSLNPALPSTVSANWSEIPTWMAAHAKFVAVYDTPFWREAGFSGQVRSQRGPLVEIHDASAHNGLPALFGFLGVSAPDRAAAGEAAIRQSALLQLQRLFGQRAAIPVTTSYMDWTADPCVATAADTRPPMAHPDYGAQASLPSHWAERVVVSGSETSQAHGGYLEGALESATVAVAHILARSA